MENEAQLAVLKEEQRDPYDIKKFEEVLGESYMMVPESEGRLKKSLDDLASFLASEEFLLLNSETAEHAEGTAESSSSSGTSTFSRREWEQTARHLVEEHLKSIPPTKKHHDAIATTVQETEVSGLHDDEDF